MQTPSPVVYLPSPKWRLRMGRVAANLHVKTRIAFSGAEDLVNILLRSPLITAQGSRGLRSGRSLTMSMRGNKGGIAHSPGCALGCFRTTYKMRSTLSAYATRWIRKTLFSQNFFLHGVQSKRLSRFSDPVGKRGQKCRRRTGDLRFGVCKGSRSAIFHVVDILTGFEFSGNRRAEDGQIQRQQTRSEGIGTTKNCTE